MKKITALLSILLTATMAVAAGDGHRPLLAEGKTWHHIYHRIVNDGMADNGTYYQEELYPVDYTLHGDTTINGQQYKKMYRIDYENVKSTYFAACREDDGRLYAVYDTATAEMLLIDLKGRDFHLNQFTLIEEPITVHGQTYLRYRYQHTSEKDGQTYILKDQIGVEGVGMINRGLDLWSVNQMDCICDYETFDYVEGDGTFFTNADFTTPKRISLTAEEQKLVEQNNDFAFRLFQQARGKEDRVMSPLSITYALGMLNNSAAGRTQQEICDVLGFAETGADGINAFCRKLLTEAPTLDTDTKAEIANTVFVNSGMGFELQQGFVSKANEYYDAQPEARDFNDGQTRNVINKWASDNTEGMVKEVLTEQEFNRLAVSYLLNAIYFKGMWSTPFNAEETQEEPFADGDPVPMMHSTYDMQYAENDLCQAVTLPYGNGAYQMQLLLPREGKTLGQLVKSLNGSNWRMNGSECMVDLKLPRFETNTNLDLKPVMQELGMPTAFNPAEADFPNLCVEDYGENFYIGLMKQVAKIEVNEQGTEAAAVTVIGMETTSDKPDRAIFHANRPFIYIISEQSTGVILFIGQYVGGATLADPCDVNGDGKIDVADIADIIDVMAGKNEGKDADVNGDGNVDVADISVIISAMAS